MTDPNPNPPHEKPKKCEKCGGPCKCKVCHIECGLDHEPTLPADAFPTADNCNPHNPGEAWLPALVGLPGMKGASMALPVKYLRMQSERLYKWGGPPNPKARKIHYHPPAPGELNPMFAAGEWKDEPPEPNAGNPIDVEKLSTALQAELKRQLDDKTKPPPVPPQPSARIGKITRFDPAEHTVTEVLTHLRECSDSERARVLNLEREGSKRRGVLKRYEGN